MAGASDAARVEALRGVIWIGGAPDAGKTTLATSLARLLGLRLMIQDRLEQAHFARATDARQPEMRAFWAMSVDERWVTRAPDEMAAQVVRSSAERFDLMVEDILALSRGTPLLVEGPWLLPELVAPSLSSPHQALWLVPATEFKRASAARRDKPSMRHETSDPSRVMNNWLARDLLLGDHIRATADALHLTLWEVDGSMTPRETVVRAMRHFAPWLA